MACATKNYLDNLGSWKKTHVSLGYFLCKKITRKQFVQLKTIEMMVRKTILSPRLSSTHYSFRCKKYICKKCYAKDRFGFTVGICNTCNSFFSIKCAYLLEGDHQLWPWHFL